MTHAIQFLEALGRAPAFPSARAALEAGVTALAAGEATRDALQARDAGALARSLGARETMMCLICTPEGEDVSDDAADGDSLQ